MKRSLFLTVATIVFSTGSIFAGGESGRSLGFTTPVISGKGNVPAPRAGDLLLDTSGGGPTFYGNTDGTSGGWIPLGSAGSIVPSGTILPFAGKTIPSGYVLCDGESYSAATHPDLAQALWDATNNVYAYGGSGTYPSGSFNVPDLRGRFLRGWNDDASGATRDQDASSRTASGPGGNTGNQIGTLQSHAFQSHGHNTSDPGHVHQQQAGTTGAGNGYSLAPGWGTNGGAMAVTTLSSTTGISVTNPNSGSVSQNETRPVNVSVNYIIKL